MSLLQAAANPAWDFNSKDTRRPDNVRINTDFHSRTAQPLSVTAKRRLLL